MGRLTRALLGTKGVTAVASVCTLRVEVAGRPVYGLGYTDLRGRVGPGIVDGRAPATSDEVALGTETLDTLGLSVGDTTKIAAGGAPRRYRIVGRAVMASVAEDALPLADGAVFTGGGVKALDESGATIEDFALLARVAHGPSNASAVARVRALARSDSPARSPTLPTEIERVRQIDGLPVVLGVFVSLVALVAVGYGLVTSVRRRRRDLAVLKTLGFRRNQVRLTIAWQATTIGLVGLVFGIPLGLIVGRFVVVGGGRRARSVHNYRVAGSGGGDPRRLDAPRGEPGCRLPGATGRAHSTCHRSAIGVTVATSLDDIQPLELSSVRDQVRERPQWAPRGDGSDHAGRARGRDCGDRGRDGGSRPVGPGSCAGCGAGGCMGACRSVRGGAPPARAARTADGARGVGRRCGPARGRTCGSGRRDRLGAGSRRGHVRESRSLLPGVGLHLVLGLPDGGLRARRSTALGGVGYLGSAIVAVYLLTEQPSLPVWPVATLAGAAALVGLVGYFARCRAATSVHERARLQWPAWAVVVAIAVSASAWVLHELVSWPDPIRTVALSTSVLVPTSLALGASKRIAVRIDRLLVHTITMAGLAAMVGGVVPPRRARAREDTDEGRADVARPLDARGGGRGAAVDSGTRAVSRTMPPNVSTASVTRPTR